MEKKDTPNLTTNYLTGVMKQQYYAGMDVAVELIKKTYNDHGRENQLIQKFIDVVLEEIKEFKKEMDIKLPEGDK